MGGGKSLPTRNFTRLYKASSDATVLASSQDIDHGRQFMFPNQGQCRK
jgi:hypothetical protein